MKIVHVTQFFHPLMGYQENNLAKISAGKGYHVSVVCSDNLDKWNIFNKKDIENLDAEFEHNTNVKIYRLKERFSYSTRLFLKGVSNILDKLDLDVLVVHGVSLPLSLKALHWSRNKNIKVVVDDHMVKAGSKNKLSSLFHSLFKLYFRSFIKMNKIRIDKYVAVSYETKEIMKRNYGIKQSIETIPLGYDSDTIMQNKELGREWLIKNNLRTDVKYILYIGKLDFNKNPADILPAIYSIKEKLKGFQLLIIGDLNEGYKEYFYSQINKYQSLKVDILPSVENVEIFKIFSIVELAIWPNGSSMAMLEAMACKCPVIAGNIPVNVERLGNGRGCTYDKDIKNDLANKILYSIENKDILAENANKWVLKYSWKNIEEAFFKGIL